MPSAFFLAQTAAEFHFPLPEGAKKAWMACHFSSYGTGLSNFPPDLPAGSMVILNDRIPIFGHDPGRIAAELEGIVERFSVSHVLLDLQRPGNPESAAVVRKLTEALPCPVGVSEAYAREVDAPVCLGPVPLHLGVEEWIRSWPSRRIWMELAPGCRDYHIGEQGCRCSEAPAQGEFPHWDSGAKCRYRIRIFPDEICFTLKRGQAELAAFLEETAVECMIGLYQEFAQPEAQDTAFAQ